MSEEMKKLMDGLYPQMVMGTDGEAYYIRQAERIAFKSCYIEMQKTHVPREEFDRLRAGALAQTLDYEARYVPKAKVQKLVEAANNLIADTSKPVEMAGSFVSDDSVETLKQALADSETESAGYEKGKSDD